MEVLHTRVEVSSLEADQPERQVALGSDDIVRPKFVFKEILNFRNVLDGFVVVVLVYGLVCHSSEPIFFCYVFLPNLNDFGEEAPGLLDRLFVSEKLTHVVVRAAQVEALRAMLFAF